MADESRDVGNLATAAGSYGNLSIGSVQPNYLTFGCGIRIHLMTGEVFIPDGMKLSAASHAFWDAVRLWSPYVPPDRRGFGT